MFIFLVFLSGFLEYTRSSDDDYLIPPVPLFKGAVRAFGLSIATVPALPASSGPASDDALLFVVAGGFEAFGVLGYLELVDTFLDITVHEGREIVH